MFGAERKYMLVFIICYMLIVVLALWHPFVLASSPVTIQNIDNCLKWYSGMMFGFLTLLFWFGVHVVNGLKDDLREGNKQIVGKLDEIIDRLTSKA